MQTAQISSPKLLADGACGAASADAAGEHRGARGQAVGARAALPSLSRTATPLGSWLRGLLGRAHGNTVVVALASKLVRIAWAVLRKETAFAAGGLAAA